MQVDYLEHMGSDLLVVNAARVSFAKWHEEFKENDTGLINFLARHRHISPFFHPQISLRLTVPFFVANQLKRHQVGFAVNETSRRYVDSEPEFYLPDKLGVRAENKKQGSKDDDWITEIDGFPITKLLSDIYQFALDEYQWLLSKGVSPEYARIVLPQATYTSWVWTGSLYAYARVYNLRSKPDAQKQTREVAHMIGAIIQPLFPVSWPALTKGEA